MRYKDPFQDPNWLRRGLSRPIVLPGKWVAGSLGGLAIFLILLTFVGIAPLSPVSRVIRDTAAPLIAPLAQPIRVISTGLTDLTSFHTLRAENTLLRSENERLRTWYNESLRLQAENKSLRALTSLPLETPTFETTARVLADPGGPFVRSILIRAGTYDGLIAGDIAMAAGGVIGRITEVNGHTARVLLLTDINARIPVFAQGSRQRAIVTGDGGHGLLLTQRGEDTTFALGQRLVTSGDGGVYAADLPVALITKIDERSITARPLADLSKLDIVRVIRYAE